MVRSSIFLLALLFGLSATAICPPKAVYSSFDGMCYYSSNTSASWETAVHSCNTLGGNLFVPNTAFENNMFPVLLEEFGSKFSWLGLYSDDNGYWYNSKTKTFQPYFRWAVGQPSINSSCVLTDKNGNWFSNYCSASQTFFCQMKPVARDAFTSTSEKEGHL